MITLGEAAQNHFRALLAQQGSKLGVRLRAVHPGTPLGDCHLEFCEPADLQGDEWEVECTGFSLFVDKQSAPFLEGANIDYECDATGGQLTIRAPRLRGIPPSKDANLMERVRYVLDTEINPRLASHGGRVSLREVTAEGIVLLQFDGGCHGCGMVDVTLRKGVERTLRERVPEVKAVQDATDHETGRNPYLRRKAST